MMGSPVLYVDVPSELLESSSSLCSPLSLNASINAPDLLQSSADGWTCSSSTINEEHSCNPETQLFIQYFQKSVLQDLQPLSPEESFDISAPELEYSEQFSNSANILSSTHANGTIPESKAIMHLEEITDCYSLDNIYSDTIEESLPAAASIDCSVCPVCAGVFDQKALAHHLRNNHANVRSELHIPQSDVVIEGENSAEPLQHACKFCNKSFPSKSRKDGHQVKCSNKALKCVRSSFVADNSELYDDHLKKHQKTEEEMKMEETPKEEDRCLVHTLDEGLEILHLTSDLKVPPGKDHKSLSTKICKFCKEKFPKSWTRDRHQNKCVKNPNIVRILRCSLCGYATKNSASFDRHVEKHNGKCYECMTCGIKYTNSSGLYKHRRKVHSHSAHGSENQVYKCHECGKEITDKHIYEVHIKRHTGIYDQMCELCGKKFKTRTDLQKHIRAVHHNRYHYHCEQCGHGVSKLSYLLSHQCKRVRRKQMPKIETAESFDDVDSFPPIDPFLSMDSASSLLSQPASESSTFSSVQEYSMINDPQAAI